MNNILVPILVFFLVLFFFLIIAPITRLVEDDGIHMLIVFFLKRSQRKAEIEDLPTPSAMN